jgi:hypothetical protein
MTQLKRSHIQTQTFTAAAATLTDIQSNAQYAKIMIPQAPILSLLFCIEALCVAIWAERFSTCALRAVKQVSLAEGRSYVVMVSGGCVCLLVCWARRLS